MVRSRESVREAWPRCVSYDGVGCVFFLATLFIAFRTGAMRWERTLDRRLLFSIIAGLLIFMTVHAAWIAVVWR